MRSNESGNEIGRDALEINMRLADGKISGQLFFVNATKGAQEIADEGPHAFKGIDTLIAS